jgi:nucleoside-diphosphate-sugar epimerase
VFHWGANPVVGHDQQNVVAVHLNRPQGVRGRNSDNARLREVLAWVPQMSLERGLELTYKWIQGQLKTHSD